MNITEFAEPAAGTGDDEGFGYTLFPEAEVDVGTRTKVAMPSPKQSRHSKVSRWCVSVQPADKLVWRRLNECQLATLLGHQRRCEVVVSPSGALMPACYALAI